MSPWLAIAIASVVAAAAFFFAGYALRSHWSATDPAKENPATTPLDAGASVGSMLETLSRTTLSTGAAVLDRDGLLVQGTGQTTAESLALAGSLAAGILAASGPRGDGDAVVESTMGDGQALRLRYATVAAGPSAGLYVVATIGRRAPPAPSIEDCIVAAIPRMHLA